MIGSTILIRCRGVRGPSLVGRAEHVRVGRVRLLGAHAIRQARRAHVLGHLPPAAEFVDEGLIEPRLVDAQARVGEQAVAVEPLDVVALEGAAVAPDVDVVFLHRDHEHRAGDGAADRRRVEVGYARGRDVERAALQGGDPFRRRAADGSRPAAPARRHTGARGEGCRRSRARPADRGWPCRRTGWRPSPHPVHRRAGIETAGERDADTLADWQVLKDDSQGFRFYVKLLADG